MLESHIFLFRARRLTVRRMLRSQRIQQTPSAVVVFVVNAEGAGKFTAASEARAISRSVVSAVRRDQPNIKPFLYARRAESMRKYMLEVKGNTTIVASGYCQPVRIRRHTAKNIVTEK